MRSRRSERKQQRERSPARDRKARTDDRGSLEDIAAHLLPSAYVTLDLHGDTRDEARKMISQKLTEARGRGFNVERIIHGFNRGSVLSAETQKVLFRLKEQRLVAAHAVNGTNPGETIVQVR